MKKNSNLVQYCLLAVCLVPSLVFDRMKNIGIINWIKNRDIFFSLFLFHYTRNTSKASIFRSKSGLLIYNRERIESLSVSLALAFHLVLRSRFSFESRLGISIPLFSRFSFASTANET